MKELNRQFHQQPRDEEGPVFNEPWEAQAFSLVIALHGAGIFSWEEWAEELAGQITKAQSAGDPDLGNTYYHHWLAALEVISQRKGIVEAAQMETQKQRWHAAYLNTPHGQPIELSAADLS